MEINVKDARSKLKAILDRVMDGDEVILLRRGKEVARLVPPKGEGKMLPSLKDFRSTIRLRGESLSRTVIRRREEERY